MKRFLRKEGQKHPDDKYTLDYLSRLELQVGHFEVSKKKHINFGNFRSYTKL